MSLGDVPEALSVSQRCLDNSMPCEYSNDNHAMVVNPMQLCAFVATNPCRSPGPNEIMKVDPLDPTSVERCSSLGTNW